VRISGAEEIEDRGAEGSAFTFVAPERARARLALSLVGRHNVTNALGALAAASIWGIGAREASEVLPRLKPAAMRGEVTAFRGRIYGHQRLLQLESHWRWPA